MKITHYLIKHAPVPSRKVVSHSVWMLMLAGWLVLSGCTTQSGTENQRDSQAAEAASEQPLESLPPRVADNIGLDPTETDPEIIEHILAGEFLGGQGDLAGAAEEYARAADISEDVQVADRATRIALQAQSWDVVIRTAGRWLALSADDNEALQALAIAQLQLQEQEQATATLARLITVSEPRSRGWQQAGSVLANTDNRDTADAILQALVARDDLGDSADGLYGQSVLAWRLGDLERAKELALQAASGSRRLDIMEWAAQLAFATDDIDAAIATYRRALEVAPGDRDLSLALAEVQKQAGLMDDALATLETLGNTTEALYTRAAYQLEAGNRAAAEDLYQLLAQLTVIPIGEGVLNRDVDPSIADTIGKPANPAVVHAYYTGQLAEQLEYNEQALEWYLQADGGEYALPSTLRAASLLAELDRVEEAQSLLQPLQNADDEDTVVNAFITESNLLQQAGMADQAVQRLTVGLGRLSSNTDLLYARSLAAAANKDVDLAEQDLRRIIREDPDNAAALNALGYTLTDLTDRHSEALSLIQKALALNPTDAATLDSMGWVKYRLGDLAEAEDFLRQAFALDNNPEIGAHLGEVLWQRGEHQEAREIWQQAASQDPEHTVLVMTLQRLDVVL